MGKNSPIEWCHHTWNPWQGCHKVSPGCLNCYMFGGKKRFGQDPNTVVRSSDRTFNLPRNWHGGGRVFVCSWSDFFIEEADPWRDEAWEIMREASELSYNSLQFLILTKRPERIAQHLPEWFWPLPNVWLGATVENDDYRWRILELLKIPAAKHFVSVEPMLGPVNLAHIDHEWQTNALTGKQTDMGRPWHDTGKLDWVICGCESGPRSRDTKLEWVEDLLVQCHGAKVPFFLKQLSWASLEGLPLDIQKSMLVKMPEFMGRVWDQVPEEVEDL